MNELGSGTNDVDLNASHRPAFDCQNNKAHVHNKDLNAWALYSDPSKMTKLRETLDNSTSISSKSLVDKILQQISQLTDIERLHLYLKLPGGRSPEYDPLKQPLNPLGNRSEIGITINWVSTHLRPNPEVSIPKKEIYSLYQRYCTDSKIKPLNTADFGKVMKQVFPDVNPRRLGNRGKSRYCYSGLGINDKLNSPAVPDLFNLTQLGIDKNMSDIDIMMDKSENSKACVSIILEWADRFHKIKCTNLKDLALNLLKTKMANHRSPAATQVLSCEQTLNDNAGTHRDVNYQLQKTIQEREKRKYHENLTAAKNFPEGTKTRKRSGTLTRSTSGENYVGGKLGNASKFPPHDLKVQTDSSIDPINNVDNDSINNNNITNKNDAFKSLTSPHQKDNKKNTSTHMNLITNYVKQEDNLRPCIKMESDTHEFASNLIVNPPPLLRTQNGREEATNNIANNEANLNNLTTGSRNLRIVPKVDQISNRYKPIESKESDGVNFPLNNTSSLPLSTQPHNAFKVLNTVNNNECSTTIQPEGKTLDETSNLSFQYPPQTMNNDHEKLRQCLNIIIPKFHKESNISKTCLSIQSSETPEIYELEHTRSSHTKIPQSPNTIAKSFDFTPIITNVGSGFNTNQVVSQCSSSNVSPFTSPTSTPRTRSRNNSGQTSSTYITPRNTPFTPDNPLIGSMHPENCALFVSPASTPISGRSRHHSTPYASRSRNHSGALSFRHNPYPDDMSHRRSQKYPRSRNISLPQSAPLSPLIHDQSYSQDSQICTPENLNDVVSNYFRTDQYTTGINDRKRHISSPANYYPQHQQPTQPIQPHVEIPHQQNSMSNIPTNDVYGLEVANAFGNHNQSWSSSSTNPATTNRPQSVPLPEMVNSSISNEVKSYPTTPNINCQFTFASECISHSSSFSSTPVPSENIDYDNSIDKDPFLTNLGDCSSNADNVLGALESLNPIECGISTGFSEDYCLHQNHLLTAQVFSPVEDGFPQISRNCCPTAPAAGGSNATAVDLPNERSVPPTSILTEGSQMSLNTLDSGQSLEGTYDHTSHLGDLPTSLLDLGGQDFSDLC